MDTASELPACPSTLFFPPRSRLYLAAAEVATELKSKFLNDPEAIDYAGNIYIESASFYKCKDGAQHEFLRFSIRDKLEPMRRNVLLLDRVPRVEVLSQPDPGARRSLDLTVEDLELSQPARVIPTNNTGPLEFSKSKHFISSDAILRGIITNKLPAADVFFIAARVEFTEVCEWRRLVGYSELESISIPHSDLTIEKLMVLAAAVSEHHPFYNLYRHQCYWYAGIVWEVLCKLSGQTPTVKSPARGKANFTRFISIAPGNSADDNEQMLTLYNKCWQQFLAETEAKAGKGMASVTKSLKEIAVERDVAVAERNTVVAERNNVVAERDSIVAERDTALEELAQARAEAVALRARLAEIGH